MPGRDVAEGHTSTHLASTSGILSAHDGICVAAACIQSWDRLARCIEYTGMRIRFQAQTCAERCWHHGNCKIRRLLDWPQTRVWRMPWVSILATVRTGTLVELGVNAGLCKAIVCFDGRDQPAAVDTDFARKFLEGIGAIQIARVDI